MLLIVTDRESDYIFVTDFDTFGEHLDDIINQACRTVPPTTPLPSPTPPPPVGDSTLQFLDTLFILAMQRYAIAALATVNIGARPSKAGIVFKFYTDRVDCWHKNFIDIVRKFGYIEN